MPACVSCGREIPPVPVGELNTCPECRAAAIARAQTQAPIVTRRSLMLERMPVTSAIIGINVLVFVAMTLSGVSPGMPQVPQLVKWGADFGPLTLTTQPWRILTSNYIHIGIIHIALNMWCLWNLGILAERIFDGWTYFLTYTVCGLSGSLASLWWHPMGVGAGASGAIFGMAGALISALYLGHLPVPPRALPTATTARIGSRLARTCASLSTKFGLSDLPRLSPVAPTKPSLNTLIPVYYVPDMLRRALPSARRIASP